jgi:hypothetical protein
MVNPDRNLYEPPYDDALLYDAEAEPERPRSQSLVVMLGFVVVAAFAGVVWVAYNYGVSEGRRDQNPPVLYGEPGPDKVPGQQQMAENDVVDPVAVAPDKSYDELWEDDAPPAGTASTDPAPDVDRPEALMEEPPAVGGQGGEYKPATIDPRMDPTLDLHDDAVPRTVAPRSLPAPPVVEDVSPSGAAEVPARGPAETALALPAAPAPKPVAAPKPLVRSEPPAVAIAPAAPVEVAPAAPVASGVSIQLGAFPSSNAAAAHWSRVKGQNQELLNAYEPKFIPVDIPGKGTLYRLRVTGFADKSAAKSVCDQIVAGGGACILAGK